MTAAGAIWLPVIELHKYTFSNWARANIINSFLFTFKFNKKFECKQKTVNDIGPSSAVQLTHTTPEY